MAARCAPAAGAPPLGRRHVLDRVSTSRAPRARLPVAPPARDATTRATASRSRDVSSDQLREQSLDACGWAELCEHLAEYASTRLGQEACRDLDLPSGGPWESELLLDETEAAIAMESHHGTSLDFGGILSAEVRRALYKAEKYASLGGDELAAMMAFISSATRLVKTVEGVKENGAPPPELAPLRRVVQSMVTHPEVADKIRACVDDQGGFKDGASPELRRARSQRAAAEAKLRRALQSANGSIATHQGRMVLAVTPPAPPGALVVGVAAGGGLVLIEPPSVVLLNGQLAQTIAAEETAIDAIRRKLTYDVAEAVVDLFACLDAVTRLDVIAARARHAMALNACRPEFVAPPGMNFGVASRALASEDEDEDEAAARARDAERAAMFPTLAPGAGRVVGVDDSDTDEDEDEYGAYRGDGELLVELAGLRQPVLAAQAIRAQQRARRAAAAAAAAKKKPAAGDPNDAEDDELLLGGRSGSRVRAGYGAGAPRVRGPVPVDVFVPLTTRAVVITGPNTGGKTAAMKAVGLASLMSRAGLFVPAEVARLPWFDAVLVDIGDSQDLMQSLSTFSARLAKQRAILAAATPRALVLMDEVGTGTSPAEGSAIGGALLERLAGVGPGVTPDRAAGLTLATTHHGELKALKYEHPGGVFENAAVEFDEVALAPTYRLLWGVPGRSRALQIAERFGLDPEVVADARAALGEGRVTLEETISALETARRGADEDIAAARALLSEVHRTIPRVEAAAARADAAEEEAETKLAAAIARLAREQRARLAAAARDASREAAREKRASAMKTGATDFAAAAAAAAAAEREAKRLEALAAMEPKTKPAEGWIPSVGQSVTVIVNGMSGAVKSVSGTSVVVQAGLMRLTVDASELEPSANVAPPKKPPAKGRSPAGTQAARRVDALLGGARTPGGGKSPPPTNEFGLDFDSYGDDAPVIGDTVRIRKSGVVGTVVDAFDGVLTVQAGRNRLKTPAEGVEFADAGGAKATAGPSGGGGGGKKSKKKEKKKGGSGLPRATQPGGSPPASSGGADINDLMAKFNRK